MTESPQQPEVPPSQPPQLAPTVISGTPLADSTAGADPINPMPSSRTVEAEPPLIAQPQTTNIPPHESWFYNLNGQQQGPVPVKTLVQWIQTRRLLPNVLVWRNGMTQWVSANMLAEFQQVIPPSVIVAPQILQQQAPTVISGTPLAQSGTPEAQLHRLSTFPVAVLILLHYVTLGIFTTIWLNLMHGKMPKIRHNDPSAGKAIGFFFIPYFNLYWMFFAYCRLCDRINEQREMRGLGRSIPKGLAITMCILMCIPYIGLISLGVLMPIFAGIVQAKVNELVGYTTATYSTLNVTGAPPL